MKVYIAGPLFNTTERETNSNLCWMLVQAGHDCYLPQRDGGILSEGADNKAVYEKDIYELDHCDAVVAQVYGPSVDSGTAFEIGYALAKGKPVLRLDYHESRKDSLGNNMFWMTGIVHDVWEVISWLED